jgi:hypothetical protein
MKVRFGLYLMAAVGLVGTTAPRATADSQKCRPNVRVTNSSGNDIKVTKFKYKVSGSPEVFTESLVNKNLSPNETENWPSQTLRFAVKGVVVSETAVEFKPDTGPGWGSPTSSAWFPHSFTCGDNHNYIQTIQ